MSAIQLWKQSDPRWSSYILGNNTDPAWNLAKVGCLVSDEAMLIATVLHDASWTPARMNEFLKANGGFDGGLLRWPIIPKVFPFIEDHGKHSGSGFLADAAAWIKDEPNYVILEVDHGTHYVLLYQVGTIADPADGKSKKWNVSGYSYTSARFYRFVGGKGGVQNVPALTTPTPIFNEERPMTLAEEQEVCMIVLRRPWTAPASGRTGYKFVVDAKAELADQRNQEARVMLALEERAANAESQLKTNLVAARGLEIATPGPMVAPPPPVIATYTSVGSRPMDAITATERLHSASAQSYGLLKKLSAWFKALVLK